MPLFRCEKMMMGARKWHFRTLKVQLSPSKSLTITSQKCNFCAQERRFLATFMRNRQQNRISFHETYHPSRLPFSKIRKIGCQDICRKINAFNLKSAPILTIRGSDEPIFGRIHQSAPTRNKQWSMRPTLLKNKKTPLFVFKKKIIIFASTNYVVQVLTCLSHDLL